MKLLRDRIGFNNDGSVVVARKSSLFLLVMAVMMTSCQAYFVGKPIQNQQRSISNCPKLEDESGTGHSLPSSRFPQRSLALFSSSSSSVDGIETEISSLCKAGQFDEAIASLEKLSPDDGLKSCYVQILKSLVDRQMQLQEERVLQPKRNEETTDNDYTIHLYQADKIVEKLLRLGEKPDSEMLLPAADDFHDVIKMWGSSTFAEEASVRCESYLDSLWSLYDEEKDERFVPMHESYHYAVLACSGRDRGVDSAKRAERLMKDMESRCDEHPQLRPNRSIADGVMNAWSKSGHQFKKGKKCEKILEGMIEIALSDSNGEDQDMAPDTNSFNIVLNALAQGRERASESRAEALLTRMESLSSSSSDINVPLNCQPDEISFNTVLNCWARSRHKGAADRAMAILDHMKRRQEAGVTDVHPDWSSYTTVLKALARDRDPSAINRAEAVFSEYQEACDSGKSGISHNAFTYNTMINCYAKSNDPDAGKRALELFETMKANMGEPGWELCFVDVYTYTSLIDSISKLQSHEASEQAISLLKEVEESFAKTGDMRFQPNIRLYTSVVNAIGRSHKYPDRAKAIVDRVESKHLEGITGKEGKPDVVFYNALMNAYGWSDEEGRSRKTFEILKHMISLFESGRLADAKPDTVSFNSVLNACVHEKTKDQSTSDDIMKTVVEAFELLNGSPEYGKPDQRTYVHILHSIANHMAKKDGKRTQMAEATFLQCASNGLVGHAVIPKLYMAVPRSRFQTLMGPASKGDGSTLKYDVSELPTKWTANALTRNSRNGRRTRSRRSQSNLQVTKKVISSSTQQS